MAEATNLSIFEWFCVVIILFAAISLQSSTEPIETEQPNQLESMTGVIELSTRSAMDAFGLTDFKIGAIDRACLSWSFQFRSEAVLR